MMKLWEISLRYIFNCVTIIYLIFITLHYVILAEHTSKNHEKTIVKPSEVKNTNISRKATNQPTCEIKINSVLARNILMSRQKNTIIEKRTGHKIQPMISVLKNPPNPSQSIVSNIKESIITTINSKNNEIENIIQQETENIPIETKRPIKRKLNLEEYRKKRENSNYSHLVLRKSIYLRNAFTSTVPVVENDESIYAKREMEMGIKPVSEINNETQCNSQDAETQTYETVFESLENSIAPTKKDDETEGTSKR